MVGDFSVIVGLRMMMMIYYVTVLFNNCTCYNINKNIEVFDNCSDYFS